MVLVVLRLGGWTTFTGAKGAQGRVKKQLYMFYKCIPKKYIFLKGTVCLELKRIESSSS
jgi:hypothetical protein